MKPPVSGGTEEEAEVVEWRSVSKQPQSNTKGGDPVLQPQPEPPERNRTRKQQESDKTAKCCPVLQRVSVGDVLIIPLCSDVTSPPLFTVRPVPAHGAEAENIGSVW
ncbi:unnamed protein product [Pleuronectes platessa]|uniref:Uncharacterized protein n=1 Tax=Pleuronectes platessa TaxID=8262 RepID=A0A9N7YV60_PLEPL|nr:unnamed protein product [Pleuronectes platessa]